MNKKQIVIGISSLFTLLLVVTYTTLVQPKQKALREAYEHYRQTILEAQLTGDTSHLPEVLTRKAIPIAEKGIRERLEATSEIILSEETKVTSVKIVRYAPAEAIIQVEYSYEVFSYNRVTGEHIYPNRPNRGWRIWKMRMLQENGVWKLDELLELVDWGRE